MVTISFARRGAAILIAATILTLAPAVAQADSPYAQWSNGPSSDPSYFPIGVWLQSTTSSRIAAYQAAGFNLYIGLWNGPTESQLSALKAKGMQCICAQNTVGLTSTNRSIIVGWMQQDEPDNAQWNSTTSSYDPPVLPSVIAGIYETMKAADSTRPIYLNLGMGVAWDGWWGRGTRTNHPEDYPLYIMGDATASPAYGPGCDIVSFDIYPFAMNDEDTRYVPSDKPWYVPAGVDRLRSWSDAETQVVWNFIECTNIHGYGKATPTQVKAEVWMSLVHGSMGICYFVHQFAAYDDDGNLIQSFIEAGLLADAEMTAAVTAINTEIRSLAPVLNSDTASGAATVSSSNTGVPVDIMAKHYNGQAYLFAVGMRDGETTATFHIAGLPASATIEVINEGRTLTAVDGTFQDTFTAYAVHLYRATLATGPSIVSWETVTDLGTAGTVANEVTDGSVEARLAGLRVLRITFDMAIDADTLTEGAVLIVGTSSGTITVSADALSLSEDGTVLTVTLPSALADGDTYTVTVTDQVAGVGGGAVSGDLDLTVKTLVGDVDGSGTVTVADILAARAAAGPVTSDNARYDLNASGVVSGDDLLAIRRRLGAALP